MSITLKAVSWSAARIGLYSTRIALFWSAVAIYWNRQTHLEPVGIVLLFVVVWVCGLPITIGSEIGWLLFRHFVRRSRSSQMTSPTAGTRE